MLGTQLSELDRQHVLNAYIYRMTFESVRRWPEAARQMRSFRLPLISDAAWLANTSFKTTRRGELDGRARFCEHDHSCRVGPVLPVSDQ